MDISSANFSESDVIARLQKIFASTDPRISIGIGDDGAVVTGAKNQIVTTDMAVSGVHFLTDWSSAFEIGRKAIAANTADVLAMSGTCDYLVIALALTGGESIDWIEELARGAKFEADLAGASIVGGDLSRSDQIVLSVTAIGHTEKAISRSSAKAGDKIYLSSLTGWSAAGLEIMQRALSQITKAQDLAVKEFKAPTIDYDFQSQDASALCDVSDALIIQGRQLAEASKVALHFDQELIAATTEFTELNEVATELGIDIWQWIFAGGEDHVLLATGSNLPGICVGEVKSGSGIFGVPQDLDEVSWNHFLR